MTVLSRHAVVIIHGIGEQVPLETVRRFVGRRTVRAKLHHEDVGVATDADRVFSEPSPIGGRTDDRAYLVTWNHTDVADRIRALDDGWLPQERTAMTDFYEFYWAPRYRTTSVGQLTGWLTPILRRRRNSFSSPRLVGPSGWVRWVPLVLLVTAVVLVWLGARASLNPGVAGIGAGVLIVAATLVGTTLGLISTARVLAIDAVAAVAICLGIWGLGTFTSVTKTVTTSAVVSFLLAVIAGKATAVLGDAARYLSSRPDSVEENDQIRQQVIDLLERLHDADDYDCNRKRYDRIILVGHSLGSVIAYDAVRLLWARRSRQLALPDTDERSIAAQVVNTLEATGRALTAVGPDQLEAARAAYVRAQRDVQLVMRDLVGADGARWVITDLVTLGSPLTYADAFMATSPEDLVDRFEERSLAATPPVPQQVRGAERHPYRLWVPAEPSGTSGGTRWHHAAPFACVEWTNLWFEHDIVGGPIGPHFGPGVTDVSLGGLKWLAGFAFAYPHSSYWTASNRALVREGSLASLRLLRQKVRRRPTLLLTARAPLTEEVRGQVSRLLLAGDGRRPLVDVRLYVGATDPERQGAFLPIGLAPLPTRDVGRLIRGLLGAGSRVALLSSPDLLAEPVAERSPGAVRPDPTSPSFLSEETEADSLEAPDDLEGE
jgi:hypothetical protein